MEITLEKVELVKDRTGVSYKEAKDALEEANGNIVDAIISIEETINISGTEKLSDQANAIIERIKETIRSGNVSKITIRKDDEILLKLPVNASIIGTVLAPWAAIIGVIAAFGTKCTIELLKTDGTVVNISDKASDKFGDVKEKGSDIADSIKEKSAEVYDNVRSKTQDVVGKNKRKSHVKSDNFKDTVDEMWEEAKKRVSKTEESADAADEPEDDTTEE
ncbi:MAG: DUF4342 domain-containing protein [Clostridiales Family XIII bacterium]|nr:DUF4342 domain-containing protein [Clostridiales Family XIII bacterium]